MTIIFDPVFGDNTQVTRCRIAGGDVVDYASDTSVPSRLYPNAGTDLTGECWYLTSAVTRWVYLALFVNGDAILGFDPDPGPGGVALATERIPRCTSEPNPLVDPSTEAWQYVTEYIHPPPTPEVNPVPGDGVTGLDTFVGVEVPDVHQTQLTSVTGVTLDIYIEVSGIVVDWGDAITDNFPADEDALAGYPDGLARHIYEVKDQAGYDLAISYDWTARWRVTGGDWEFLDVPETTTSLLYPVAEIVSVVTE
ncbi:MAG: hypothetical protein ACRDZM_05175 [Acidimicrobiia bacterium]